MHTEVVTVAIDLAEPPPGRQRRLPAAAPAQPPPGRSPHEVNLDGIFGKLANVVWTSVGPCAVSGFEEVRLALRADGPVQVFGVDKFPRMTDYVLPTGVRIADADRVRLGAHLAEGTTVMHEGFVQLQRRHARRLDGRGPDQRRGRRRGRLRHRWRRLDHGHPLRWRQGGHLDRRALPARGQRRHRHLAGQRLRRGGGLLRHRRHQGDHQGHRLQAQGDQGRRALRSRATCCSAATR